jgi:hypothetical protein
MAAHLPCKPWLAGVHWLSDEVDHASLETARRAGQHRVIRAPALLDAIAS